MQALYSFSPLQATDTPEQRSSLTTPQQHYNRLHDGAHGTVVVWEKLAAEGQRQWHKLRPGDPAIPLLLAAQAGKQDRYITVNEFHGWKVVQQLKSLRACYVDIDGFQDLAQCLEVIKEVGLPSPTFAVWSGRGLHLYWRIEAVPAKALPVWQSVQNEILAKLQPHLPVDPVARDCTRVLRLVGSVNSKSSDEVRGLVIQDWSWTMHTLADEVLGFRPGRPANDPEKTAPVRSIAATRTARATVGDPGLSRWHLVYRDLLKIGEHHWFGGIPEGQRDAYLFLYCCALSWFAEPETLRSEVFRVARTHTPGLSDADIQKAIEPNLRRALAAAAGDTIEFNGEDVDPRYRFRRQTLYSWLKPIIGDDLLPELRSIIPDSLARERKAERDAGRSQDRNTGRGIRAGNENKAASARLMASQGMSQRKIAATLGVSAMTISLWLRRPDSTLQAV